MDNLLNWYNQQCEEANFNRLGVMAFVLLVQTCVIVPATLLTISMNGNNVVEFAIMAILSFSILVSLLADMPSKIILPVFAFSTIVHLLIILINLV